MCYLCSSIDKNYTAFVNFVKQSSRDVIYGTSLYAKLFVYL